MAAIRVRRHPDGTVTVAGLQARDLTALLTGAELHSYESLERFTDPESVGYYERRIKVCKALKTALTPPPEPGNSVPERWRRVREDRQLRRLIDEVLREMGRT